MTSTATPQRTQLLSFVLAGEEYAVDILRVREIIGYSTLTRVPGMPRSVRGVINLRGRVVPVVDLAVRFGLPESEITARSSIVMVDVAAADGSDVVIGIITDAVTAVLDLDVDSIQPTPSLGTKVGSDVLDGMAGRGDALVMLLNIDRALGSDAFVQDDVLVHVG
jgi:purine-binding chemotaxis protein CheW